MSYFPETFTFDNLLPSKKKLEKDLELFQQRVEKSMEKGDMHSLPIIFDYDEPDNKTKFAIAKELHSKFPNKVQFLWQTTKDVDIYIYIWTTFNLSSTEGNTQIIRGLRLKLY